MLYPNDVITQFFSIPTGASPTTILPATTTPITILNINLSSYEPTAYAYLQANADYLIATGLGAYSNDINMNYHINNSAVLGYNVGVTYPVVGAISYVLYDTASTTQTFTGGELVISFFLFIIVLFSIFHYGLPKLRKSFHN
jgi:hypothetical protein